MHETSREALRTKKRVASFIERRTGQLSKMHHGRYHPFTILEIKIFSPSFSDINTKQAIFRAFILSFLVSWFVIQTCV